MAEIHRPQNKQGIADCCSISDCQTVYNTATQPTSSEVPSNAQSVQYRISNMDCPVEEKLIRNKLEGMNGIVRLDFNLINRILNVHHQLNSLESVTSALKAIGMDAQLVDSEAHQSKAQESASLSSVQKILPVSYTHLTLPTIYSV